MSKHHAIIELHCTEVSDSMIIKQLKVPKSTVYDTVARFNTSFTIELISTQHVC